MDVQDPYKQMYFLLFHAITDWTEQMQEMQQKAEALFMQGQQVQPKGPPVDDKKRTQG